MLNDAIDAFRNFRSSLYDYFHLRSDAIINLVDSIAGNIGAQSPVELSLSSLFPRSYNSIYDAIKNSFKPSSTEKSQEERSQHKLEIMRIVAKTLPPPGQKKFILIALDATSAPRLFSPYTARSWGCLPS